MKPLLYLDVDGVINVVTLDRPEDVPESEWRVNRVDGGVKYDQRVVEWLNHVHRDNLAEIVWLTTWERRAAERLAPAIGLDNFRLPIRPYRSMPREGATGWWKFSSVLAHAQEEAHGERAILWVDDDLEYSASLNPAMERWERAREKEGLATLCVSPDCYRALTMEELALMEDFLRSGDGAP